MINILEHGNIPKYVVECLICKCKFEYDIRDVSYMDEKSKFTQTPYVKCPECSQSIPVQAGLSVTYVQVKG